MKDINKVIHVSIFIENVVLYNVHVHCTCSEEL